MVFGNAKQFIDPTGIRVVPINLRFDDPEILGILKQMKILLNGRKKSYELPKLAFKCRICNGFFNN